MGVYTGTVPTFLAGELPDADKFTEISNFMLAATGAWTTWTPTLTALTVGNGTVTARYRRLGKTVDWLFRFALGSTSAVGTGPSFTLPAAPAASYPTNGFFFGGRAVMSGTDTRQGELLLISGSTIEIRFWNATPSATGITATVPWTWATNHYMAAWGTYEAA